MRDEVPSNWRAAVLVCGKCSRKLGGGFGKDRRTPLTKALRALGDGRKGRKADAGIVETRCLKLCPKGRVVVIDAGHPSRWLLVEPGTPIARIAERLGLAAAERDLATGSGDAIQPASGEARSNNHSTKAPTRGGVGPSGVTTQ